MAKGKYNIVLSEDKWTKLDKAQAGTRRDIKEMIRTHKLALMIRPTGFGKTHTLIDLCKQEKYKSVIYMYPTDVIRQSIEHEYHNPDSKEGIKYADTKEEAAKNKHVPYIEFVSYKKMLMEFNRIEEQLEGLDEQTTEMVKQSWADKRFGDVDLLVLDEAHMTGANGFMKYWKYIHNLTQLGTKDSRLHVLGATATPLRTNPKVDIERDIFYYYYGKELKSARIRDFNFIDCWRMGILMTPYYTKGIIDIEEQEDYLVNKLHKTIVGVDIDEDPTVVRRRGRIGKSGRMRVLNDSRTNYVQKQFDLEKAKLAIALSNVPSPSNIIINAVRQVVPHKLNSGSYMRFLVFYQNTEDMIKYHDKINKSFIDAFNIGGEDSLYSKLNTWYILSDEERIKQASITKSKVDVITDRDSELDKEKKAHKDNPDFKPGAGNIDLIHSINMLNMGYHVGDVTGVVVKRSTSSEIIYYQQIGRCMSIKAVDNPIIIDFANAEAELFFDTNDTVRQEAANTIKEFISGCILSDDYEKTDRVYGLLRANISDGRLSDEMLEYLYVDRKAPLYFIKGVSDSLNSSESIEDIIVRLNKILNNKGYEALVFDDFALGETRLSKFIVGSEARKGLIQLEMDVFKNKNIGGESEDA